MPRSQMMVDFICFFLAIILLSDLNVPCYPHVLASYRSFVMNGCYMLCAIRDVSPSQLIPV